MTDGLRKSHLRKAPQVGLSEVGLPEGNPLNVSVKSTRSHIELYWTGENCDKTKEVILAQHIQ